MSESQQGPEICDVISRKRHLLFKCVFLDVSIDGQSGYPAIFKLSWYFRRKHISLIELDMVMRIYPSFFQTPSIY